jgi:fatty-acyl-CoA synthase
MNDSSALLNTSPLTATETSAGTACAAPTGGGGAPAPRDNVWPAGIPRDIAAATRSLWHNLEESARRTPDKSALVFFGTPLSFAQLKSQAERMAGWLRAKGVKRGHRVILFMQNSPQFAIAFYAIVRADAVVVPVNPMNKAEELGHYITDPGVRVAIAADDIAHHLALASDRLAPSDRLTALLVAHYADYFSADPHSLDFPPPALREWLLANPPQPQALDCEVFAWRDLQDHPPISDPHEATAEDLAVLPYTSGTTGLPKGCMHTHATLAHNIVGCTLWNGVDANAVVLSVVPMFHITGLQLALHLPISVGCTAIVLPRWDRAAAAQAIARWRVTHWTNIPTMVIDLLAMPDIERCDLSSLRYIGGGGAAMPAAIAQRLEQTFGLRYVEGYGLTETAAPTHSNPLHSPKLHCLGIPYIGTQARVVDPATLAPLPTGEQGEIVVRGPQVFKGYWNQPDATQAVFVQIDGERFFRTGDLGYVDEEGYFFITDRLKRMINASGYKVWPAEVEALMYRHPDVQEACVIATRDDYRGESVKAVVVLRAHARGVTTADDLIQWSRGQMAAYKCPRVVEFVDALPKSGSGKILWRVLQEREDARKPRP